MCELCGQTHPDLTLERGHWVCASRRWCLLYAIRTADDLQIARMHRMALESLPVAYESLPERASA